MKLWRVIKRLFRRHGAPVVSARDTDRRLLALLSLEDMLHHDCLRANQELRECIMSRLFLARTLEKREVSDGRGA